MPEPTDEAPGAPEPEPEWQRRRRLAAVFGDVLPDTTADERDAEPPPDSTSESPSEAWLKAQRPPHHGG